MLEILPFEKVTFLVFATDETSALEQTVGTLMRLCDEEDVYRYVVIYPKDASVRTVEIIRRMEKEYPGEVVGFEQIHPSLGGAVSDAIRLVESSHLAFISSDLAYDLRTVPRMIGLSKQNPGAVVKTSRWLQGGGFFHYSPTKRVLNRIAQAFLRVLYSSRLTDFTGPCQIVPTELCRSWNLKEKGFPVLIEMITVPVRLGDEIIEVPAKSYGRREGTSGNSFLKTAAYLLTAFRVRFTPKERLRNNDSGSAL